jgi:SPW repeat
MDRFSTYWEDTLNLLLGVALFVSPSVLGFASEQTAASNAYVVGVIIAAMAIAALFAFQPWEEWVSAVLGAWLVISPWVLGFSGNAGALLTHLLIGIVAIILALLASTEHYSGHPTT